MRTHLIAALLLTLACDPEDEGLALGERCYPGECSDGLYCDTYPSDVPVCEAAAGASGSPCMEQSECLYGLTCGGFPTGPVRTDRDAVGHCQASPDWKCEADEQCLDWLRCGSAGECYDPAQCADPLYADAPGCPCESTADCGTSAMCSSGQCARIDCGWTGTCACDAGECGGGQDCNWAGYCIDPEAGGSCFDYPDTPDDDNACQLGQLCDDQSDACIPCSHGTEGCKCYEASQTCETGLTCNTDTQRCE